MREIPSKGETRSGEDPVLSDFADDSDLIESSLLNFDDEYDFIKRGKINTRRLNSTQKPLKPKSFSLKDLKSSCSSKENNCGFRVSLKKTCSVTERLETVEKTEFFETPFSQKNASPVVKKLISTLKKTPEGPYLSKSKLQNIQQWLTMNSTEIVRTPPFANLSVTPRNFVEKKYTSHCNVENKNFEDSSIDSEVEDVLKAVYGKNWKHENVKSRSKTEPKKKLKNIFSPRTEYKMTKPGTARHFRRNILNVGTVNSIDACDDENKFDDSVLSGVKIINLDISWCSDEHTKAKTMNQERKRTNSEESFPLSSEKNAEVKVEPQIQVKKSRTRILGDQKPLSHVAFKIPKKTFLASLSVSTPTSRCHPDAHHYKVNFKSKKDELIKKLYRLYNTEVFDSKLPDELHFSWNVKLRGTAGYCYNKRITKSTGEVIRLSRIEFSTKIVDRADRLRDTMIHELCHAASWMLDGVLDGHGTVWTNWASRAMSRFPELPPIKKCHNYDIVSKYVYRCTTCGYSVKRHSKSINTNKKRCGHCYGVLELLINKKKKGKREVPEFDTTRTLPTPNKFAMFVKENYHSVKSGIANAKHSEVMKTLSQQYALIKNGPTSAKKLSQQ